MAAPVSAASSTTHSAAKKRSHAAHSAKPAAKSAAKSTAKAAHHKTVAVKSHRKTAVKHAAVAAAVAAPAVATAGDMAGLHAKRDPLALRSNAALVMDQNTGQILFEKNASVALPIASLTKLMTAMVVLEARQNMDEILQVTDDDVDRERFSASRLRVGSQLSRANMLHIALMSSENRAASALGRHYPGGLPAFVAAMNAKARTLGMSDTRYVDPTGLSSNNVASARDLAKLVNAAYHFPTIREYSTDDHYQVDPGKRPIQYTTSNRLVLNPNWKIGLQKTGYINEAGRCLVMQATIESRPVIMVFLDSKGKDSRIADASRIRKWLEASKFPMLTQVSAKQG
ncbi:D-alanyl-D-alanine endopeptidase [Noviherbaspirillum humi]|uniref:D-alanyl-D-alanine endopeptidase n=1 Tax=Noviherbaspirillum humi TaxID=1688639 RepID=UPI001FE61ABA|nr:D-alanyl-D-alanine endopeptidase [Noviherbaspirillum humi]